MRSQNFKRLAILAKNNGKAVSDIIGIDDLYTKFCIDEAADYLYFRLLKNSKSKEDLATLMAKYSTRKKRK